MKELSRKVFLLIFGILILVLLVSVIFINVQSYRREYESIRRSLDIMNDRGGRFIPDKKPDTSPEGEPLDESESEQFDEMNGENDQETFENMMIMDQDVYTVDVRDGNVVRVLKHGNEDKDFDASKAAEEILKDNNQDIKRIDNLYSSDYAFNYRGNRIVIVNTKDSVDRLRKLLLISSVVFTVMVGVIYFLSKVITGWITKPARESFDKQREFIADASHELKTPLAVIMASSDEMKVDEENSKYIDNIKFEAERMNRLIAGMLNLSKIEAGVTKAEQKEENLSKIVEKTVLVFEGMAFEKGVMIETDIDDGIKKKCCRDEMEKLISTILDNAIKHSFKDTAIQVSLKKPKNKVVLKITNTGDPIKEGEENKIFERFYRSDKSRSRSENRYGLGLAIAKSIVQNHDGTIKAKSENGKTTFTVEL